MAGGHDPFAAGGVITKRHRLHRKSDSAAGWHRSTPNSLDLVGQCTFPSDSATAFRISSLAIVATDLDDVFERRSLSPSRVGIDQARSCRSRSRSRVVCRFRRRRPSTIRLPPGELDLLFKLNAVGQDRAAVGVGAGRAVDVSIDVGRFVDQQRGQHVALVVGRRAWSRSGCRSATSCR